MTDPIDTLLAQHRRMFALLDLLEHEVTAFAAGEAFDAYVVDGALDYISVYPDRLHRPLELLVYKAMQRRRDAEDPLLVAAAEAEHATLSATARELRNAVVAVARHATPPRGFVADKAQKLIRGLRRHMEIEEQTIFPLARETLTSQDYATIASTLREDPDAPDLADEERAFDTLYRTVMRQRDLGLTE